MSAAEDTRLARRIFTLTATVVEGREALAEDLLPRLAGRTDLPPMLETLAESARAVVGDGVAVHVQQRWLTVADVAALTGYSQWSIRKLARDGVIPFRRLHNDSRFLRFAPSDIYGLMATPSTGVA